MEENQLFKALKEFWDLSLVVVDKKPVTIGSVLIGIIVLSIGLYLSKKLTARLMGTMTRKLKLDKGSAYLVEVFTFYFILFISVLLALKIAGIPLTIFTLVGGAVAIGIGFGSQNVVNNFISGLTLMLERPIKVGDFIEVEGSFGEVENIGIRSTKILTYGNKHIIIPNGHLLDNKVTNWTLKNKMIRTNVEVGVAYGSDVELVKKTLLESLNSIEKVLKNHNPIVFFENFSDSALSFKLEFWTTIHNLDDKRIVESEVRSEIDRLFKEQGIRIPFPQRDVHLFQQNLN